MRTSKASASGVLCSVIVWGEWMLKFKQAVVPFLPKRQGWSFHKSLCKIFKNKANL